MTRRPYKVGDRRCCHCYRYCDSNVSVRVSQPDKFTRNLCSLLLCEFRSSVVTHIQLYDVSKGLKSKGSSISYCLKLNIQSVGFVTIHFAIYSL